MNEETINMEKDLNTLMNNREIIPYNEFREWFENYDIDLTPKVLQFFADFCVKQFSYYYAKYLFSSITSPDTISENKNEEWDAFSIYIQKKAFDLAPELDLAFEIDLKSYFEFKKEIF